MRNKFDKNENPIFSTTENILINILCYGGWTMFFLIGLYVTFKIVRNFFNVIFENIQSTDIYIFATTNPNFFILTIFIGLFLFAWFCQIVENKE